MELKPNSWNKICAVDLCNDLLIIEMNNFTDITIKLLCSFDWPLLEKSILSYNNITIICHKQNGPFSKKYLYVILIHI
jgi:hypothetical protein